MMFMVMNNTPNAGLPDKPVKGIGARLLDVIVYVLLLFAILYALLTAFSYWATSYQVPASSLLYFVSSAGFAVALLVAAGILYRTVLIKRIKNSTVGYAYFTAVLFVVSFVATLLLDSLSINVMF